MSLFRIVGLMLTLVAGTFLASVAPAMAQDAATPEAEEIPLAPESDGTPVAQPIRVITLLAWYETDASGDFIDVGPLASNDQLIAGPGDSTVALTGRADFDGPEDDGIPEITVGDSVFHGVPAIEGDDSTMFRWTYPQGDGALRPATLVIQVEAVAGPYEGFSGSATFVSRSVDPGSGVIVIMLNPPEDA